MLTETLECHLSMLALHLLGAALRFAERLHPELPTPYHPPLKGQKMFVTNSNKWKRSHYDLNFYTFQSWIIRHLAKSNAFIFSVTLFSPSVSLSPDGVFCISSVVCGISSWLLTSAVIGTVSWHVTSCMARPTAGWHGWGRGTCLVSWVTSKDSSIRLRLSGWEKKHK